MESQVPNHVQRALQDLEPHLGGTAPLPVPRPFELSAQEILEADFEDYIAHLHRIVSRKVTSVRGLTRADGTLHMQPALYDRVLSAIEARNTAARNFLRAWAIAERQVRLAFILSLEKARGPEAEI